MDFNESNQMQNTDQIWIECLLSPSSDIRVYADQGFLSVCAYTDDFSSEIVIKEDCIY